MKQYLRLKNKTTIVYPPEMAASKKDAEKLWGKNKWVEKDIEPTDDTATFADKLKNGAVVQDAKRVSGAKAFNDNLKDKKRDRAKIFRRTQSINEQKLLISADKDYDDLTPLERKLMFGIDGGPTDAELGIE